MTICFLMLGTGVAVCGYLVIRHVKRTPAVMPTPPVRAERDAPEAREFQAIQKMENTIKIAPLGDDTTGLRLRIKLRREEEKQRPEEGRN